MDFKKYSLVALLAASTFLAGCATKPQAPVSLTDGALAGGNQRVGVVVAKLPKPGLSLPGADCLLCIMAATAANSTLGKHAETLTLDEFTAVRNQLATALRKKGSQVQVISEELDLQGLPEAAAGEGLPKRNFAALKQKFGVDKLLVVQLDMVGFERNYAAYFPTTPPRGVLKGAGYMVNLSTNTYEWYLPVNVMKGVEGAWDEPAQFPGLTNAFYQVIETGKDRLVEPFAR